MFEQVFNYVFQAGTGAGAVESADVKRDDTGAPLFIEAWSTGGLSNMYLIAGKPTISEAAAMLLGQAANTDILCVIPAGSSARRALPSNVQSLTVYTDAAMSVSEAQVATVRIWSP